MRTSEEDGYAIACITEMIQRVHAQPDGKGTLPCVRCSGTLHYEKRSKARRVPRRSRQPKSERVWSQGRCTTEGCVAWMV